MAIGRQQRRQARKARVVAQFGESECAKVLDLFELVELAWHDCYDDISPPENVIDEILLVSEGDLGRLISAARLAVADWRDLRMAADAIRTGS